MVTEIKNFLRVPPHASVAHKILHFLCIGVMILGAITYLYITYEATTWTLTFPSGSKLEYPLWMMHTSVRFLALWMPFAIVLIRWNHQRLPVAICYIAGCSVCLALSVVSTIMIDDYKNAGELKAEYVRLLTDEAKQSGSSFPIQVILTLKLQNCCGWSGPIDFGPPEIIDVSSRRDTDLDFMTNVAACYGNTFSVERGVNNSLIYKSHPNTLPPGCGAIYKRQLRRICYLIGCGGIVVDFLAVAFIVLYLWICCESRRRRVAPTDAKDPRSVEGEEQSMTSIIHPSSPTSDHDYHEHHGNYITILPLPPSDYTFLRGPQKPRRHSRDTGKQKRRSIN